MGVISPAVPSTDLSVGGAATQSSVLFQVAFDCAPIGVALTAPDGSWLDVNDALCELTGYSKDELLERTSVGITHPDDQAMSREVWLRHNAGGDHSTTRIEKRYVRPDGQIVWVDIKMTRVDDAGGTPVTVAHIENITGRRDAQRSLEEAEERFRRAFDDAPIGMALVGLDGRWLRANASLCEILGYSEPELLKLKFQDLTHPDDLEASNAWVRGLLTGKHRSFAHEKRYLRKDGNPVWTKLSVSLVRDTGDVPLYFVAQIEDVDERKLTEAEIARLLAQEREQVVHLQELDSLKDEFVALVSHELRTPLTSIQGYTELLLDDTVAEEHRDYLDVIDRNASRLLSLVNDLLLIAEIQSGKLVLETSELQISDLLSDAAESARPRASAKGIDLQLAVSSNLRTTGDRSRLGQVLDNLVSNAIKFTPEGGTVRVSSSSADGMACIVVSDSGIGIPKAEQAQMFSRFFRTSSARAAAIPGTGLGLTITRGIVESHGGTIDFESEEGVGTTFRVELPLRRVTTA